MPATVLKFVETYATEYAKQKGYTNKINSLKKTGKVAFVDMFDYFAGTSTGALMTSALSYPSENDATIPKYNMDDIIEVWKTKGKDLFRPNPGPSAGEIIVWILFFVAWVGLFYFLGRYFYDWPAERARLEEAEAELV